MLDAFLGLILTTAAIVTGQNSFGNETYLRDDVNLLSELETPQSGRQGRFFPFFSVVRFANSQCSGSQSTLIGTCFTKRECISMGGVNSGSCANGLGVCCVFKKNCGSTTNINNTYFMNPEYPLKYQGGEQCSISVTRCNSNICQLRIDFLDLRLAQPNADGNCDKDVLLISGGSTNVPRLCGQINQHVYVDFNNDNPITINVHINSDFAFDDRRWNFQIKQIACDSAWRAPTGCLQYYTDITNTVTSFNYGTVVNPRAPTVGSRQMANLMYGVCVRMAIGYCGIEWSQSGTNSFVVTGDPGIIPPNDPDPNAGAESGLNCDKDFVIIPNPFVSGTVSNTDRFCGTSFSTKTSSLKPFVLYVVTNGSRNGKIQSRGFSLTYKQTMCAV
ncbi:uncharacterized protein LOC117176524 [Belonocnema kinseyi]|uniref:uncharacterized protein LOC117176524 n=1 Tax=Belonocnema kinseyi TaxID=2817044 RepID=UPI00143D264C|nr:uncharacterized protein LOC117176524 [Belonocnema kinseyi]